MMREMVQVVLSFAIVIAIYIGIIWGVDSMLGVYHVNADDAEVGGAVVFVHHLPSMLFGGALMWLYVKIFVQ